MTVRSLFFSAVFALVPLQASASDFYKCPVRGELIYTDRKITEGCVKLPSHVVKSFGGNVSSSSRLDGIRADLTEMQGSRSDIKQQLDAMADEAPSFSGMRLSPEEIHRAMRAKSVIPGMSRAQVLAVLGPPPEAQSDIDSVHSVERWYYWAGEGIRHYVVFRNGKVSYFR